MDALRLLLCRIGSERFALPADQVERVERMAALTPLPEAPLGIAGLLNLRGAVLPVVDPRPRLGAPSPAIDPDQHLIVVAAGERYLLWVDRVEQLIALGPEQVDALDRGRAAGLTGGIARIEGVPVPILSLAALAPGPILATSSRSGR